MVNRIKFHKRPSLIKYLVEISGELMKYLDEFMNLGLSLSTLNLHTLIAKN